MPVEVKLVKKVLQKHLGYLVTYGAIAEMINKDEDAIKMRAYRGGKCNDNELQMICDKTGVAFSLFFDDEIENKYIKVPYYENGVFKFPIGETYDKYFPFKKTAARKWNKNYKEDDFKILCALDDVLDGGERPIAAGDVVLIDTSFRDAMIPGKYIYECHGGSYVRAAVIQIMMDETFLFTYPNKKYSPQERTPQFLKKNKFKIVGRIIKNLDDFDR